MAFQFYFDFFCCAYRDFFISYNSFRLNVWCGYDLMHVSCSFCSCNKVIAVFFYFVLLPILFFFLIFWHFWVLFCLICFFFFKIRKGDILVSGTSEVASSTMKCGKTIFIIIISVCLKFYMQSLGCLFVHNKIKRFINHANHPPRFSRATWLVYSNVGRIPSIHNM